jgi:hypothetical protein
MQATLQKMDYCAVCVRSTPHIYTKTYCNHILHLLLSIFTGGIWVIIWLLAGCCSGETDPACTLCGSTNTTTPREAEREALFDRRKWLVVGMLIPAAIFFASIRWSTQPDTNQVLCLDWILSSFLAMGGMIFLAFKCWTPKQVL